MTEIISPIPSPRLDRPTSFHSFAQPSRPLSEISENEDRRRISSATATATARERRSRPNSEIKDLTDRDSYKERDGIRDRDKDRDSKRLSAPILLGGQIQTLSLNLNEYASSLSRSSVPSTSNTTSTPQQQQQQQGAGPTTLPNSPSTTSLDTTPAFGSLSSPGLAPPIRSEAPVMGVRTVSMTSIKEVDLTSLQDGSAEKGEDK
jgi:hypothetical protein